MPLLPQIINLIILFSLSFRVVEIILKWFLPVSVADYEAINIYPSVHLPGPHKSALGLKRVVNFMAAMGAAGLDMIIVGKLKPKTTSLSQVQICPLYQCHFI